MGFQYGRRSLDVIQFLFGIYAGYFGGAVGLLIAAGVVRWTACIPVGAGAMAGGYLGARLGKRLSPPVAHVMAVAISASITIAFFIRACGTG